MAISISISISISMGLIPSPRNQLLPFSFPNNHHVASAFLPPVLPQRSHHTLSYRRCCFLSAAIPQSYLQEEDLRKELISVIGEELYSIECLHEALVMVDLIQRLGIQRFFKQQIDRILKSAYMQWDEKYGLMDANVTVLSFRLLRLHGYDVSGDVLKILRDKDTGSFSTFLSRTSEKISGLLNLYKCSQIGFPQESEIMDEAEDFSNTQLIEILSDVDSSQSLNNEQYEEIKFSLTYPRKYLLSRLEARSIVRRSWPSNGLRRKCLELACLDLEMLQKLHQKEMNQLYRWLDEQGFEEFSMARIRSRLMKCYIGTAMAMFEPEFSLYRLLFTKICFLASLLDDLYDPPRGDKQRVSCLQEAFQRWDASPLEDLPLHKAVFMSICQTLNETAIEASNAQGCDLLPYIRELWLDAAGAWYQEAEWLFTGHSPSLEEYLPVGARSVFLFYGISSHIFILGEPVSDRALQYFGKDSHLLYLASVVSRLANDLGSAERELEEGKLCNAVRCYMNDHPDCMKEDAIAAIKEMIEASLREMEWEILMCRGIVPGSLIQSVMQFVQAVCINYRKLDGYKSTMDTEWEELLKDYIGY